jgi:hypothetical protein
VYGPQFIYSGQENLIYINFQDTTYGDTIILQTVNSSNITIKPAAEMAPGYYYLCPAKNYIGKVSVTLQEKNYLGWVYDRINFMVVKPVELVPAIAGVQEGNIDREDIFRNPQLNLFSKAEDGTLKDVSSQYEILSCKISLEAKGRDYLEYNSNGSQIEVPLGDKQGLLYRLRDWPAGGRIYIEYLVAEDKATAQVFKLEPLKYVLK